MSKSPGFHWGWGWGLFCRMGGSLMQAAGSLVTLGVLVGFAPLLLIEAFIFTLSSVSNVFCLRMSCPDRESLMSFGKQRGLIIILSCVSEFSCQLLSSAINTGFCLQHMLASCSFLLMFLSVLFMVRFFFSFFFFSHTSSYQLQSLLLQFHPVRSWFPSLWASTTSP